MLMKLNRVMDNGSDLPFVLISNVIRSATLPQCLSHTFMQSYYAALDLKLVLNLSSNAGERGDFGFVGSRVEIVLPNDFSLCVSKGIFFGDLHLLNALISTLGVIDHQQHTY